MTLHIKNREVEEMARELARRKGKRLTEVVRDSLKRELEWTDVVAPPTEHQAKVNKLMEIGRRAAALPVLNDLTDDEILGYDEFGAPTR